MINGINNIVNYSIESKKITTTNKKELEAAKELSQVLIKQFLDIALKADENNELFSIGYGGKIYNEMMNDEYAKLLSEPGNAGLTEQILSELIKLQEVKK